ncbi:MAG: c-type cytochrome [Solirubrobacterales bacterium]|nr:c-type cytochrome [Solirubrobacterales bacterium]
MQIRPHNTSKKTFALGALLVVSVFVAGCGNNSKTSLSNGKTLFTAKCGGCHKLARASTVGTIGPDLDEAFRQSVKDGMGDTIQGVVEGQIKYPSQKLYPKSLVMPPDLVTGMDANDVAAYVSYAVAKPGKDPGALGQIGGGTDGRGLFKTNCAACHRLADAGTVGTVGPNLDQTKLGLAAAIKQIENGGNGMPAFKGALTDAQIKLIAAYLEKVKGK